MDAGKQRMREPEPLALHRVRTPPTWKLFVIPLVVVALLIGAILTIQQRFGASPSSVLGGPGKGTTAATFTAPSLNGPRFSLAAQRGHPVVLFFMAASCTSCLLESNALGRIQHKYGSNVRIALIDIGKGDSSTALRAFVQRSAGPSRFWILDSDGTLASTYGVQTLDTTYVVDKGGRIVYSNRLPVGFGELDRAVRQVV
jgi:peroxiredoxin